MNEYTWALILDLHYSYQNIAKQQIKIYSEYIPLTKNLLDVYKKNLNNIDSKDSEKEIDNIVYNIYRLPKVKMFLDIAYILEDNESDAFYRINKAVDILKENLKNPENKNIIRNFQTQVDNYELYQSFMAIFGKLDISETVTTQLFSGFEQIKQHATEVVLDSARELMNNIIKNDLSIYLSEMSTMMVQVVHDNILTKDDEITVKYVVSSKISRMIYSLFKESTLANIMNAAIPNSVTDILQTFTATIDKNNIVNYHRIMRASMLQIDVKVKAIREKINYGTSFNKSAMLLAGMVKEYFTQSTKGNNFEFLAYKALEFTQDYINLSIEINKLEIAMLILHLHNSFIANEIDMQSFKIQWPSENELFNSYDKDKAVYITKIGEKIANIVGLAFVHANRDL